MTVADSLKIEINGTLDLHHFNPADTRDLVSEFIFACHSNKIYQGKIIHGKGIGTIREIVHSRLKSIRLVKDFWQGNETSGGWGVTIFSLHCKSPTDSGNQDA